jgi:hypothetical protein
VENALVFISHATTDKRYAEILADYIKRTMVGTKTFVASDAESIPSGSVWFQEILHNLSNADALVAVYSRNARSSLWLGFELGHFWRNHEGENIHCVFDPSIELPSPLNQLQAKDFKSVASMAVFFTGLAQDLRRDYKSDDLGITELVDEIPKHDRFARWKSLLKNGNWTKQEFTTSEGYETVWISEDDMSYQIAETDMVAVKEFNEPWVKRFPDKHTSSYYVNLIESGSVVKQETFVSLDGARYFVPIPKLVPIGDKWEATEYKYYYERDSLSFLLGEVIGSYYIVNNLEEFAARQGIEIY